MPSKCIRFPYMAYHHPSLVWTSSCQHLLPTWHLCLDLLQDIACSVCTKVNSWFSPWNYFSLFSISISDIIIHPVVQIRNSFDFYLSPIFKPNGWLSPTASSSQNIAQKSSVSSHRFIPGLLPTTQPCTRVTNSSASSLLLQIHSLYSIWSYSVQFSQPVRSDL